MGARVPYRESTADQERQFLDHEFLPPAPRARVVPEREAIQARMLAQEKQRLGRLP